MIPLSDIPKEKTPHENLNACLGIRFDVWGSTRFIGQRLLDGGVEHQFQFASLCRLEQELNLDRLELKYDDSALNAIRRLAAHGFANGDGDVTSTVHGLKKRPALCGQSFSEKLGRRNADSGASLSFASHPSLSKSSHCILGEANIEREVITEGTRADCAEADGQIDGFERGHLIADQDYDSDALRKKSRCARCFASASDTRHPSAPVRRFR